MEAHDLAEKLLTLKKGTKVYINNSYDDCFGTHIDTGKLDKKEVVILTIDPRQHISKDHIEFDKFDEKINNPKNER